MRVFVSYRRLDSAGWTGRLVDALSGRFGKQNIFHDVQSIEPGKNWFTLVSEALHKVDYTLVVIGPTWLTVADERGHPRLDGPEDLVRIEVATALRQGKPVIPVLVGGARMPSEAALPTELKPLTHQQAVELTEHRWPDDVQQLLTSLAGRIWWWKLLWSGAGLLQVIFLGLWIYTGVLGDTVSSAEAQSVQLRNAYIQKMQSGTDECMAGIWPKGAVKGKTYKENDNSVTELCSRVSGSLDYFGRFFDDNPFRLPPSPTTADAFDKVYDNTFNRDFEPFLREGWTIPASKDSMTLAHRAKDELAAQAQQVLLLKRSAGSTTARIEELSSAVFLGKVWTLMMVVAVVIWLIRRRTRFFS